jgi:hypothetical protein
VVPPFFPRHKSALSLGSYRVNGLTRQGVLFVPPCPSCATQATTGEAFQRSSLSLFTVVIRNSSHSLGLLNHIVYYIISIPC